MDGFAGWGHSVHNGDHVFSAGQEFDAGDSEDGNGGGFFLFGFLGFFSVVPASRESSSLSNSSGEIFSSLLILMCSFRGFLC